MGNEACGATIEHDLYDANWLLLIKSEFRRSDALEKTVPVRIGRVSHQSEK
jgi:hypothetical protein